MDEKLQELRDQVVHINRVTKVVKGGKNLNFSALVVVGDGKGIRFWEDTWLGDAPLAEQYPSLYAIVRHKNVVVNDVLSHAPLNIGFTRTLTGNKWTVWLQLVEKLMGVNLTNEPDSYKWRLTQSGMFSVKSMYADYMNGQTRFLRKYL